MTLNDLLAGIEEDATLELAEQAREYPEGVAASLKILADEEEERAARIEHDLPTFAELDRERAKRLRGYASELCLHVERSEAA